MDQVSSDQFKVYSQIMYFEITENPLYNWKEKFWITCQSEEDINPLLELFIKKKYPFELTSSKEELIKEDKVPIGNKKKIHSQILFMNQISNTEIDEVE